LSEDASDVKPRLLASCHFDHADPNHIQGMPTESDEPTRQIEELADILKQHPLARGIATAVASDRKVCLYHWSASTCAGTDAERQPLYGRLIYVIA
jgi:hypothetical protein